LTLGDLLGLAFVVAALVLMLGYAAVRFTREPRPLREIPTFQRLQRAIGLAVEAGSRLHLSLGRGNFLSTQAGVGFAGLSVLDRIARSTSISDKPPVASAGEATLSILTQEVQRKAASDLGGEFDPARGRLTGVTPLSYAAGAAALIDEEGVGANLLVGNLGAEVALIIEAGERAGSPALGGTDNLSGQAVLFASADHPLIGEETFASGAYLGGGRLQHASLYAQDILRWVLIFAILGGAILKLVGIL
jgi:hypothetical protein